MNPTVAEQFVGVLRQAGVERVYGVVGDSLNPIVDAIRRTRGIEWIHVRNDVDDTRLAVAATNVETWHRVNETYADAPTGLNNVTLARGDDDHYCVQDARWHLAGPGGAIAPGPCP